MLATSAFSARTEFFGNHSRFLVNFRGAQYGIGTVVGVVANDDVLFSSSVTSVGQIVPFHIEVSLTAGDTVVFSVGPDGGLQNTGLGATITLVAATPVFSPKAGKYSSPQSVTITDTTPGAVIYYTTNGTTPTTSSTEYSGAITVSTTETIKAIAVAIGYGNSAVAKATYTIE
jgi:hypothetical protein